MQQKVLLGMNLLQRFLQHFSRSVPADIGADLSDGLINFPAELLNPKRRKFTSSSSPKDSNVGDQGQYQQHLTGWHVVAQILNNLDDIANHDDLIGFPELASHTDVVAH